MSKRLTLLNCFLLLISLQNTFSTKIWAASPGFSNPSSWVSGYVPCSQDEIVFPEVFSSAILLPTTIDITGITLPNYGALILQPDAEIIFSSGIDNGFKCENDNQKAELKQAPTRQWFDPHNWIDIESIHYQPNPAVPHIESIPCSNELVQIPATGPLSIDLSDVKTLRVGQINLDGAEVSKEFLEQLFKSELGEVMFKSASLTQVEYYKDQQCGCHQADIYYDYEWEVCRHVQCERPKCMTPIVPTGHCCAICGVVMKVIVNKCDQSYPGKLSLMIEQSLKEQEMTEQLNYHVSLVDAGVSKYLQAIIVEKEDYKESSLKFVHQFNTTVSWDVFKGNHKEFFTSGRPYNPNGLGTALTFMSLTLLGVLVFFVVVFVNFIPGNGLIHPPRWMHVGWNGIFQSPFVFARFDNTAAAEGDAAENVVIDVQQYTVSPEYPEDLRGTSTSFDNPMFVDKKIANEPSQEDADDIPLYEEDLTEIDLDAEIEGKL